MEVVICVSNVLQLHCPIDGYQCEKTKPSINDTNIGRQQRTYTFCISLLVRYVNLENITTRGIVMTYTAQ